MLPPGLLRSRYRRSTCSPAVSSTPGSCAATTAQPSVPSPRSSVWPSSSSTKGQVRSTSTSAQVSSRTTSVRSSTKLHGPTQPLSASSSMRLPSAKYGSHSGCSGSARPSNMLFSSRPMRPQTRQPCAPAMPNVCVMPAKATSSLLHSHTVSTSSGIHTVKGMRAVCPGSTFACAAVSACTLPCAWQVMGPSIAVSPQLTTLSTHWRAWPGISTGWPM